jgi:hypothetical protein
MRAVARGHRDAARARSSIPITAHRRDHRRSGCTRPADGAGGAAQLYARLCRHRQAWHIGTLYHRDTHLPPLLRKLCAPRAISSSATTSPMR